MTGLENLSRDQAEHDPAATLASVQRTFDREREVAKYRQFMQGNPTYNFGQGAIDAAKLVASPVLDYINADEN